MIFRLFRRSERALFDKAFYLKRNEDVAQAHIDPFEHFMSCGWREGRDPSPNFNLLFYVHKNLDGRLTVNPLTHFIETGRRDKVKTVPADDAEDLKFQADVIRAGFDAGFYAKTNLGVGREQDLVMHFLNTVRLGHLRDPSPHFSMTEYLDAHHFLRRSTLNPYVHFVLLRNQAVIAKTVSSPPARPWINIRDHGEDTVRSTLALHFDGPYYLAENPDVKSAGIEPLGHYIEYGWREGRNPTPLFWTRYYLDANRDVSEAGVNPFYHYIRLGKVEGRRPNPIGAALWPVPKAPPAWAGLKGRAAHAQVVIIMPVYRGYDDTLAAIEAVLTSEATLDFQLLVINDASPEADLTEQLRRLGEERLFEYLENDKNLGFVQTVNRGLAQTHSSDVILLNSDTCVFGDWVSRLRSHAYSRPNVATVTPFSNNATICSYPDVTGRNGIALELSLRELDTAAWRANAGRNNEVPTGVGFCMYVTHQALATIGPLDLDFGQGYSEENDFCMRARRAGLVNLHAHDIFVFHTGQVSFAAFAGEHMSKGDNTLAVKHPDYRGLVRRYVSADPASGARRRLDLFRLARSVGSGAAVHISHSLGGGIETHVETLLGRFDERGIATVLLRVDRDNSSRLNIVLGGAEDIYRPNLASFDLHQPVLLREFLIWLEPRLIHVHSLAGMSELHFGALFEALITANAPLFYTAHDFGTVCARNHFVRADGVYCGGSCLADCGGCHDNVHHLDSDRRRAEFAQFLSRATTLAPSRDTAARISSFFPGARVVVRPHESRPVSRVIASTCRRGETRRIAALGAIGPHKGSNLLLAAALDAKRRSLPIEFKVIGYTDLPDEMAAADVVETGPYLDDKGALRLVANYQPHAVLLPSIWPETYCYTLSLAFELGIPPIALDLGAPAERIRAAGFGHVLDLALAFDPARLNNELMKLPLESYEGSLQIPGQTYPDLLQDFYGLPREQGGSVTKAGVNCSEAPTRLRPRVDATLEE